MQSFQLLVSALLLLPLNSLSAESLDVESITPSSLISAPENPRRASKWKEYCFDRVNGYAHRPGMMDSGCEMQPSIEYFEGAACLNQMTAAFFQKAESQVKNPNFNYWSAINQVTHGNSSLAMSVLAPCLTTGKKPVSYPNFFPVSPEQAKKDQDAAISEKRSVLNKNLPKLMNELSLRPPARVGSANIELQNLLKEVNNAAATRKSLNAALDRAMDAMQNLQEETPSIAKIWMNTRPTVGQLSSDMSPERWDTEALTCPDMEFNNQDFLKVTLGRIQIDAQKDEALVNALFVSRPKDVSFSQPRPDGEAEFSALAACGFREIGKSEAESRKQTNDMVWSNTVAHLLEKIRVSKTAEVDRDQKEVRLAYVEIGKIIAKNPSSFGLSEILKGDKKIIQVETPESLDALGEKIKAHLAEAAVSKGWSNEEKAKIEFVTNQIFVKLQLKILRTHAGSQFGAKVCSKNSTKPEDLCKQARQTTGVPGAGL